MYSPLQLHFCGTPNFRARTVNAAQQQKAAFLPPLPSLLPPGRGDCCTLPLVTSPQDKADSSARPLGPSRRRQEQLFGRGPLPAPSLPPLGPAC